MNPKLPRAEFAIVSQNPKTPKTQRKEPLIIHALIFKIQKYELDRLTILFQG